MRQDDKQLRMGDKVLWRGGFGQQPLSGDRDGHGYNGVRARSTAHPLSLWIGQWFVPIGRSLTSITTTGHILSKYNDLDKNRSAASERNNIRINNYM